MSAEQVEASGSVGDVAFAALARSFAAAMANERGARLGTDTEALHDMRVATRRVRAALELFADALPARADRFREDYRWLAESLGRVRDIDVQLARLDEWVAASGEAGRASLGALRAVLEEKRSVARTSLLDSLDSDRYSRLCTSFAALLDRGPLKRSTASRMPIRRLAPQLIEDRYRAVRKAGDGLGPEASPERIHRLRIRCKRLRYALEFLSDVYPETAPNFVRRLVATQDLLGLHQDAVVAQAELRALARGAGGRLSPETVFAMGEVSERYSSMASGLRARLPAVYLPLKGKSWKDLRGEMARNRDVAALPPRGTHVIASDVAVPARRARAAPGAGGTRA